MIKLKAITTIIILSVTLSSCTNQQLAERIAILEYQVKELKKNEIEFFYPSQPYYSEWKYPVDIDTVFVDTLFNYIYNHDTLNVSTDVLVW